MSLKAKHLMMFAASLTTAILAAVALMSRSDAGPSHSHRYGDDGMFIAHEWGTFTSVQGSDGMILEGLQHEQESLPEFVHSVTTRTDSPFRDLGDLSANVPVRRTYGKMETPVIYFYTDRTRRVRVRVSYTQGLLSHFFPRPATTEGISDTAGELNLADIIATAAEWTVDVVPPRDASPELPEVESDNIYGFAREVKAAYVESDGERERFIFYRGLGNRTPAVSVSSGDVESSVFNSTPGRIPAAFALEMNADRARFVALGPLHAGGVHTFSLEAESFRDKRDVIRDLESEVEKALAARGLYSDEAAAMVKTWSNSWFGDTGTRVLYLVPDESTEELLPLEISPLPDKLVRVLVGRIEYMTPAQEQAVRSSLARAASGNESTRNRGMFELAQLGRFLEPKLRRVVALTYVADSIDADVKARGLEILSQL